LVKTCGSAANISIALASFAKAPARQGERPIHLTQISDTPTANLRSPSDNSQTNVSLSEMSKIEMSLLSFDRNGIAFGAVSREN
jgi:hypothetical protein